MFSCFQSLTAKKSRNAQLNLICGICSQIARNYEGGRLRFSSKYLGFIPGSLPTSAVIQFKVLRVKEAELRLRKILRVVT